MDMYGIFYDKLIKTANIKTGDTVKIALKSDKDRTIGYIAPKVLEIYKHHVLLDFGKFKECRRIADIKLGLID